MRLKKDDDKHDNEDCDIDDCNDDCSDVEDGDVQSRSEHAETCPGDASWLAWLSCPAASTGSGLSSGIEKNHCHAQDSP